MNRIVLIGNGFDLAHGLKTGYKDFIFNFWEKIVSNFFQNYPGYLEDPLFERISIKPNLLDKDIEELKKYNFRDKVGKDIIHKLRKTKDVFAQVTSILMDVICRDIEYKGWVDIEEAYYNILKYIALRRAGHKVRDIANLEGRSMLITPADLNLQLNSLILHLVEYLKEITQGVSRNERILKLLKAPIKKEEIAISSMGAYESYCNEILEQNPSDQRFWFAKYNYESSIAMTDISAFLQSRKQVDENPSYYKPPKFPEHIVFPQDIVLLSFNYTDITDLYLEDNNPYITVNHIHGEIGRPHSIIFGYGDELDDVYSIIKNINDNEFLRNVKSIKYLESSNYRSLLSKLEEAPFQVYILGHSCGNSDRTLLNTMFEHPNCVSIKPFYHEHDGRDNYLEIIQNISRNFTDMKLMRDRVVNKEYCQSIPQMK